MAPSASTIGVHHPGRGTRITHRLECTRHLGTRPTPPRDRAGRLDGPASPTTDVAGRNLVGEPLRLDGPASPTTGVAGRTLVGEPLRLDGAASPSTGVGGSNLVGEPLRYDPASHDACRDPGNRTVPFRPVYAVVALLVCLHPVPAVVPGTTDERHQAVPVPGPRPVPRPHPVAVGFPGRRRHRAAPALSATCSRWARSSGSATCSGLPDWVTQRFWLGTISLAAALGARWLFSQPGRSAGRRRSSAALVYGLTPYQLAFTARISVLLLPWAALPWLVGLTIRAVRRGGWRDPAVVRADRPHHRWGERLGAGPHSGRSGDLDRHGTVRRPRRAGPARAPPAGSPSCRLGVSRPGGSPASGPRARTACRCSTHGERADRCGLVQPGDILRGIGNWFFYGYDRRPVAHSSRRLRHDQPWWSHATSCRHSRSRRAVIRWRHRVVLRAVRHRGHDHRCRRLALRPHHPVRPSWKPFTTHLPRARRSATRPGSFPCRARGRRPPGRRLGAISPRQSGQSARSESPSSLALALLPVWRNGFLTPGLERPDALPAYWKGAIAALDAGHHPDPHPRGPRLELRDLPVGQHRRADHAGSHRPPVPRA